ncbi:hypothetical protein D3C78_315150 [compost metagenome]
MARKPTTAAPAQPLPYELLASRIKKQILSPRAQLERRAVIARQPDEAEEDWALLLEQLSEEESVTLAHQEDGAVLLTWEKPLPD